MNKNFKIFSKSIAFILVGLLSECEAHPKSGFFIEAGFESGYLETREQKYPKFTSYSNSEIFKPLFSPKTSHSKTSTTNTSSSVGNKINQQSSKAPQTTPQTTPNNAPTNTPTTPTPTTQNVPQGVAKVEVTPPKQDKIPKTPSFNDSLTFKDSAPITSVELSISDLNNPTEGSLFNDKEKLNNGSIKFSTKTPVRLSYDSANQQVSLESFIPVNLADVDLYVKVQDEKGQTKEVQIATIVNLPKNSSTTFDASKIGALEKLQGHIDPSDFVIKPGDKADKETIRVINSLNTITTNIHGHFTDLRQPQNMNWCSSYGSSCFQSVDPWFAEAFSKNLLNLAFVLDSQKWEDAINQASFTFHDEGREIPKQEVIDNMRGDSRDLRLQELNRSLNNGIAGLGSSTLYALESAVFSEYSSPLFWDPNATADKYLERFYQFLHEYSHTRGYKHNGNMTYNGGYLQPYGEGFTSVTTQVWLEMARSGELPFMTDAPSGQYDPMKDIPKSRQYNPITLQPENSMAVQSFATALNDIVQKTRSNTQITPTTSQQKAPMLGFNTMLGYQQYFNNVIGLSYYGFFNYNHASMKGSVGNVVQMGLGVGSNLLLDFVNVYNGKQFKSSFGIFAGARGVWNNYKLLKKNKNLGNVHFTTGVNYRYKHSKFSLGISVPLINQKIQAKSADLVSEVTLQETPKNMHIFLNYGWIF
ncbi:outer membrane beta-barrel protein [Helicobacter cetorum]|uniref:outer membrane beta-barrel protein n=1 Tax=Helicobacter cetorum TaxID=138563 RepID=UPI000CF0A79A|nr:outer membrane beta-barrel protein [Helicobacter cetorum]